MTQSLLMSAWCARPACYSPSATRRACQQLILIKKEEEKKVLRWVRQPADGRAVVDRVPARPRSRPRPPPGAWTGRMDPAARAALLAVPAAAAPWIVQMRPARGARPVHVTRFWAACTRASRCPSALSRPSRVQEGLPPSLLFLCRLPWWPSMGPDRASLNHGAEILSTSTTGSGRHPSIYLSGSFCRRSDDQDQ